MNRVALDSNILIYSHDKIDLRKQNIARNLIVDAPVVSTQVVSEYANVLRRLMAMPKDKLLNLIAQTLTNTCIYPVDVSTIRLAEELVRGYDFQMFDSIIVASALEAGCTILYSEDMQHFLKVDRQLTIVNPFR